MGKLTQAEAEKKLKDAGITWHSSGNCTTRSNKKCTSFEDIQESTVDGIIELKTASNCEIIITGGTEVGHAGGTKSHYTGYKLDIKPLDEISDYIKKTFKKIDNRAGDNAPQWKAHGGVIYAREGDHWDITF